MPDLFGAPVGISAAEADMRATESHLQQMAKGSIEIQQAAMTLAMQQKVMTAMQAQAQGQQSPYGFTNDVAGNMDTLANIAMQSGLPDKAKSYATAAATIRHQNAEISKAQIESAQKDASLVGSLMEGVKDPASWQAANMMYQMQTGRPSRWGNLPYSPELVNKIIAQSQTIKDRALTAAANAREKDSEAETREREARIPLIEAQTEYYRTRDTALRKAGATAKIPKSSDLKAITDQIKQDYDITDEHMRVLARPVAEHMLELIKNEGLTPSQAATKAYQEAKERGDFGGARKNKVVPGSGKAAALPLPMDGGKVDRTKLRDNLWYNVQGEPRLLMDGKFYTESELKDIQQPDEDSENPDDSAPAE